MKNRALKASLVANVIILAIMFVSLGSAVTVLSWIPVLALITIISQVWCVYKKKDNTGARIGNYGLLLALVGFAICLVISVMFDPGPDTVPWVIGMLVWTVSSWSYRISCLGFIVGALIPNKTIGE